MPSLRLADVIRPPLASAAWATIRGTLVVGTDPRGFCRGFFDRDTPDSCGDSHDQDGGDLQRVEPIAQVCARGTHDEEKLMAVKQKVTVSVDPQARRPSLAERRAAASASLAGLQQKLKREAAERRAERAS